MKQILDRIGIIAGFGHRNLFPWLVSAAPYEADLIDMNNGELVSPALTFQYCCEAYLMVRINVWLVSPPPIR